MRKNQQNLLLKSIFLNEYNDEHSKEIYERKICFFKLIQYNKKLSNHKLF